MLMNKKHIFVVDDEEDILELIKYNLEKEGFKIDGFTSGEDVLKKAKKTHPDLFVLDLMLPGVDGLEVCKTLKSDATTKDIPIIMLTAKGEEPDIVSGLELGADDYITKPFSPKILTARIKAVLRRKAQKVHDDTTPLQYKDLLIHPGRHEVMVKNKLMDLTLSEYRILHLLLRKPGWVFTRYQIVQAVHGEDYPVTDRSVDVQIVGLRKKLGSYGKNIETVRGVGYRFKDLN